MGPMTTEVSGGTYILPFAAQASHTGETEVSENVRDSPALGVF